MKCKNSKYKIQNTKRKIQNTKYKIQNTKYKIEIANTKLCAEGYHLCLKLQILFPCLISLCCTLHFEGGVPPIQGWRKFPVLSGRDSFCRTCGGRSVYMYVDGKPFSDLGSIIAIAFVCILLEIQSWSKLLRTCKAKCLVHNLLIWFKASNARNCLWKRSAGQRKKLHYERI